MAKAPRWKVYNADGKYVAACKYAEDAATVVASYDGGTIRDGHHKIVWREGAGGRYGSKQRLPKKELT